MFVSIGASLKMSRFGAFFIFRDVKKLVTHSVQCCLAIVLVRHSLLLQSEDLDSCIAFDPMANKWNDTVPK